jgi:VIT1/CCC1 family predicted Fe2+/Mn2+ transporter
MSMAAGEYVSVHSQADTAHADLKLERAELATNDKGEHEELATIYVGRGPDPALAKQVADQLMAHDALGRHARDERGITETLAPHPPRAAFASATGFAVGAAMPLCVAAVVPDPALIIAGSIPLLMVGVVIYLFFATAIGIFFGTMTRSMPQLGMRKHRRTNG